MFKVRVLSGIALVILAFLALYFGDIVTASAMFLLSIGGVYELLKVYGLEKKAFAYIVYLVTAVYYVLIYFNMNQFTVPLIIVLVLLCLVVYVITYPKYSDKDVMVSLLSFVYVSLMLSYVFLLREMKYGGALVILIFICSWVNDTAAYLVGVKFGKHKMAPVLSPKKSVEGLFGGIAGALLVGFIYGIIFNKYIYEFEIAPYMFAVIGVFGAIVAVLGDLSASAIKRNNDVKDYGKLIPGHGGILDRFDSIIFTAPVIYYGVLIMTHFFGGF